MTMRHLGPITLIAFSVLLLIAFSTGSVGAHSTTTSTEVSSELQAAVDALRDAKLKFLEARQKAANISADQPSADRQALIAARTEQRKATFGRILDVHQRHLESTKTRVENMPNIDETQKQNALGAIDEALTALATIRQQVEAATTDAQFRTIGESLRAQLQSYHTTVKQVVQAIHQTRVVSFISQASGRADSLEGQLAALSLDGKDVTALQSQLTAARDSLVTASSQAQAGEVREAVKTLKDAYALMRDVAQGIQSLDNGS